MLFNKNIKYYYFKGILYESNINRMNNIIIRIFNVYDCNIILTTVEGLTNFAVLKYSNILNRSKNK